MPFPKPCYSRDSVLPTEKRQGPVRCTQRHWQGAGRLGTEWGTHGLRAPGRSLPRRPTNPRDTLEADQPPGPDVSVLGLFPKKISPSVC